MVTYRFLLLVPVVVFVALVSNRINAAEHCESLYVVTPPENHGGTIYLSPLNNGRYGRAGYLPVGTFLQLQLNGEMSDSSFQIRRIVGGPFELYFRFVGADGTAGFVRKDSVTSLRSMFDQEFRNVAAAEVVSCRDVHAIIVPIDPSDDVAVYYHPARFDKIDPSAVQFSRTDFKLVFVLNDPIETVEATDGTIYNKVLFVDEEVSPERFKAKPGYLREADRDFPSQPGTYRISVLPTQQALRNSIEESAECGGVVDCVQRYFDLFFGSGADTASAVQTVLQKRCGVRDTVTLTLGAGFDTSRLPEFPFTVGAEVNGSRTLEMPSNEEYQNRTYNGVTETSGSAEVLLTLSCDGSDPTNVRKVSVVFEELSGIQATIGSDAVLQQIRPCLVSPADSGPNSVYADKVFIVPYPGPQEGYFSAFSSLSRFLRGTVFSTAENVSPLNQERIISFLINLMSAWQGHRDAPAPGLRPECSPPR